MTELDAGEIAPPSFEILAELGAHLIVETTHDAMAPQYRMMEGERLAIDVMSARALVMIHVPAAASDSLFLPNRAKPLSHRSPSSGLRWLAHLCAASVSTMVSRETIYRHEIMVLTGSSIERQVDNIPMAQRPTIFIAHQTRKPAPTTNSTAPVLEKSAVFHVKHTVFVGCPFGRYSGQKRTRYNSAHTSLSGSRSF
jgi:hypothetical protein